MFKQSVLAFAIAAALSASFNAFSAEDLQLDQIRTEIQKLKDSYEARIQSLEKRLEEAESRALNASPHIASDRNVSPLPSTKAAANALNPDISMILGGTYRHLSQNPSDYRLQGFIPSGNDIGPGNRSFNLGESELTLSANVDPHFSGKLTFSLSSDNQVSVEEAFFQTQGLSNGINIRGGRFLSSVGYLNSQHAHAWDFVDAPLVYQAMFGGQYKPDGMQLKWLAPSEQFLELGFEVGNGNSFPGSDGKKNGVGYLSTFAHVGDDLGENSSWRTGFSYMHSEANGRLYTDPINNINNTFDGISNIWILDGIYKWAPNGNANRVNLKIQGEYFYRNELGTLTQTTHVLGYSSLQSGGYIQAVYQFMPEWRSGLRYDRMNSGTPDIGFGSSGLTSSSFPLLANYFASRTSLMFDHAPSEFSLFRLQLSQDKSRPEVTDNQIILQYIMSLGVHGAHSF